MATDGVYFNDSDKFNVAWLRNLYAHAKHDEHSIASIKPTDLARFRRVHLFAGIGGWEEALALAGWPANAPIWTGSCPCQPYSVAGKRKGKDDHRDLWPEMYRLVSECRPSIVVGEQVPGAIGHGWLDRVSGDLEVEGYAVGSVVLGAHSVRSPHKRDRIYWGAVRFCNSGGKRHARRPQQPAREKRKAAKRTGAAGGVDDSDKPRVLHPRSTKTRVSSRKVQVEQEERKRIRINAWQSGCAVLCRDGKLRRISAECGDGPVAYGIPRDARQIITRLCELGESAASARRIVREARSNRVGRLRGYGNGIVPQVAAVFVRALMDELGIEPESEGK